MLCRSKRCWRMVCASSPAPLGTAPPDLQSFCCRLSPQHPLPCRHPPLEPSVTLTLPPGDAGAGLQRVIAPNGQWQWKPPRGPRVVTIDQAAPPTSGRHRPPPASHPGFASCSCTASVVQGPAQRAPQWRKMLCNPCAPEQGAYKQEVCP